MLREWGVWREVQQVRQGGSEVSEGMGDRCVLRRLPRCLSEEVAEVDYDHAEFVQASWPEPILLPDMPGVGDTTGLEKQNSDTMPGLCQGLSCQTAADWQYPGVDGRGEGSVPLKPEEF